MKYLRHFLLLMLCCSTMAAAAQRLVILHTNDTHSHIDATHGRGGVLQRKALIDSVRASEKNVLLLDAGDVVQGSLYFKLFGGAVEFPLMNLMGYDYQILGNHEFDNGIPALASIYPKDGAVKLASNYDFSATPLKDIFLPWHIREIDGKKVGLLALNLKPEGIIGAENSAGLVYHDIAQSADSIASLLRSKGCEFVIAISHIGYTDDTGTGAMTDPQLAATTRGIDLIVGGHSHTEVRRGGENPDIVMNHDGVPVQIVQTGRHGDNLGYVAIDLGKRAVTEARLIPVRGISESLFDPVIIEFLRPYRQVVDSINARVIATTSADMPNSKKYGESPGISNLAADIALDYASAKMDSLGMARPALAIINSGGIRLPFPKGCITEGQVLSAFPFTNRVVVVDMSGSQLQALLLEAAAQEGQAVSRGTIATRNGRAVIINGQFIDPAKTYRVATLDYLADGGDYLSEFKNARRVWTDTVDFCAPVMDYFVKMGASGTPVIPVPMTRILPL